MPHVILGDSGQVVGRVWLNSIIRGYFQSCSIAYWVNAADNGRGLAGEAVREMVRMAFNELGMHRVQGEIHPRNIRSQRVLERAGFVRYGLAPAYLQIDGRWQDHVLYQLVKDDPTE